MQAILQDQAQMAQAGLTSSAQLMADMRQSLDNFQASLRGQVI